MKLIVDGGSTSTKWAIIDGLTVRYINTKGINLHFVKEREIIEVLNEVKKVIKDNVSEIYFYGSGLTSDIYKEQLHSLLKYHVSSDAKVFLESDLVGASLALFGKTVGIVCILGTGAATGYFDGIEFTKRIPSLGFWLGDEGSGADLGKRLIKAYLRKELPNNLTNSFEEQFGVFEREFIFDQLNIDPRINAFFAKFTTFLKNNENNSWVNNLIENAFEEFIEHHLLGYQIEGNAKIGFVGSVAFYFKDILMKKLALYYDNEIVIIKNPIESLADFHATNVQ
jgi:glucosamine kinase